MKWVSHLWLATCIQCVDCFFFFWFVWLSLNLGLLLFIRRKNNIHKAQHTKTSRYDGMLYAIQMPQIPSLWFVRSAYVMCMLVNVIVYVCGYLCIWTYKCRHLHALNGARNDEKQRKRERCLLSWNLTTMHWQTEERVKEENRQRSHVNIFNKYMRAFHVYTHTHLLVWFSQSFFLSLFLIFICSFRSFMQCYALMHINVRLPFCAHFISQRRYTKRMKEYERKGKLRVEKANFNELTTKKEATAYCSMRLLHARAHSMHAHLS